MSDNTLPLPPKATPVASHPDAFSRQRVLPDIGALGQKRLGTARALILGAGGLGAPVAMALAAAGVGHLSLIDDDVVEPSNLNRQLWFAPADVGHRKVQVAAAFVRKQWPSTSVDAVDVRVVGTDIRRTIASFDVVLDCTDGMPTKFMINDACVLEHKTLVHGAATAWHGQVLTVPGRQGPCLRCLFEGPPPADTVPSCRTAGILGAVTGTIGNLMAAEAIKSLVGVADDKRLVGRFLAVDMLTNNHRTMRFSQRGACAACGDTPTVDVTRAGDYERRLCDDDS